MCMCRIQWEITPNDSLVLWHEAKDIQELSWSVHVLQHFKVKRYRDEFKEKQGGKIGITLNMDWRLDWRLRDFIPSFDSGNVVVLAMGLMHAPRTCATSKLWTL